MGEMWMGGEWGKCGWEESERKVGGRRMREMWVGGE